MMLTDFLRYPGVFKESVLAMCLLSVPGKFLKMLPEGAILWVQKTPELGHFKKL